MALYALEDVDDALAATRAFLWPVDRSRWLKLALVAFFVGAPGGNLNLNLFQSRVPSNGTPPGTLPPVPAFDRRIVLLVAAVVAVALLVGLLFALVGSIMEFVLVESLRRESVAVREYWGRYWRKGLRLFGFRLLVVLFALGGVGVLAATVWLSTGGGAGAPFVLVSLFLLAPFVLVLAAAVGLLNGFTTAFVVPIMILEDSGVLAGWRRLWSTIAANPWQYLAYAVVSFVLSLVGGVFVAVAIGVALVVLLLPFGVLGALGGLFLSAAPPVGIAVLAVVGLAFALAALAVAALAQVPVVTYLRYYALLVLGDVDDDLDLIPERRAAVREGEAE